MTLTRISMAPGDVSRVIRSDGTVEHNVLGEQGIFSRPKLLVRKFPSTDTRHRWGASTKTLTWLHARWDTKHPGVIACD